MRFPVVVMQPRFVSVLLTLIWSAGAMAQDYCLEAQRWIGHSTAPAELAVHQDFDSFVESKTSAKPLQVHQYLSRPSEDGSMKTVMSCKLKTPGSLRAAYGSQYETAGVEGCDELLVKVLIRALATQRSGSAPGTIRRWRVEPEQQVFMGPAWLDPWPFTPVTVDESGEVVLHSKALYVSDAWWIPAPARFKGVHYCHMASPEYVRALVDGRQLLPGDAT